MISVGYDEMAAGAVGVDGVVVAGTVVLGAKKVVEPCLLKVTDSPSQVAVIVPSWSVLNTRTPAPESLVNIDAAGCP